MGQPHTGGIQHPKDLAVCSGFRTALVYDYLLLVLNVIFLQARWIFLSGSTAHHYQYTIAAADLEHWYALGCQVAEVYLIHNRKILQTLERGGFPTEQ
jgi:hypothetical protein